MAFPTVQFTNTSAEIGNVTTHTVSLPATVAANDFLVIVASINGTPTITPPSGWTLIKEITGTNHKYASFKKLAAGTEGGTTVTFTTSASEQSAHISLAGDAWSENISDIEVSTGAIGSTANPDSDSVTASWGSDDNLFIATTATRRGDRTTNSYPANYADNQITSVGAVTSSGSGAILATRELAASNDDPGTFGLSGSTPWSAATIVIKPSAGGATALVVNDMTQGQQLGQVTLTQQHVLAANDLNQAQELSQPTITQHQILTVSDLNQLQQLSEPTLTAHSVLSVNDLDQLQQIEQSTLIQHNILVVDNIDQAQQLSQAGLTQHNVLVVNGMVQAQELGEVTLGVAGVLDVNDMSQAQQLTQTIIDQIFALLVNDIDQTQELTSPVLSQHQSLVVDDMTQSQLLSLVNLGGAAVGCINGVVTLASKINGVVTMTPLTDGTVSLIPEINGIITTH